MLAGIATLAVVAGAGHVGAQSALGMPTIGTITVTTNTITVPWTAPSDDGGSAITAYDLQYIRTDADETVDANWTVEEDVWTTGGSSLEHDIKDLPDGVEYDVEVRAVNANNPDGGPWSDTDTGTTTDYGGTTATATELTLGSSLPGSLDPANDKDVFRIVLTSDADLWVYTTGDLDTVGELLDSGGAPVVDSNSGTLLDSPRGFGIREELSAGAYYVRVSSYLARAAGSYAIHAQTVTDPGDTIATATTVTLDSATPGRIGPEGGSPAGGGDADVFTFELDATTDVWVVAIGRNEIKGGPLDTVGKLLDAGEIQQASNDDGHFLLERTGGFMFRRQLAEGTYYIRVNGFGKLAVGPYTLHIRTATEPGSTVAAATPITFGKPETGRLVSTGDKDYFNLTLAEDTYVFIYAVSFGAAVPLTATIRNDQNAVVSMYVIPNTNWAQHRLHRVAFSLWGRLTAGDYNIEVAPSGSRTRSYVLRMLTSSYGPALEECTGLATPQSDPWYGCQWHLRNTGQFEGGAMQDINVESVWAGGNMGTGINVVVIDDGLQSNHQDLAANVLTSRNHDYTGRGGVFDPIDTHGTAVAGLIAARDNDAGVRGVAPRAGIFGYNLIGYGAFTTDRVGNAMYRSENAQHTAVANNSWGYRPTALPTGIGATWEAAVERGVTDGYGKKGIFYVWAAGNGHEYNDHANLDEIVNFYAVTAACAVGHDDVRSDYSETGANLWVCAPSNSGRPGLPGITTTHQYNRYRDNFGGTSAAAPIVSGVAALVRAANTTLTWRDVKLILAASARKNDPDNTGWEEGAVKYGSTTNERYSFNHEYGFGMVDAAAAVALALALPDSWTNLPTFRSIEAESGTLDRAIPDAPLFGTPSTITSSLTLDPHVGFVEFIAIEVELEHEWFRDLQIELVSPSGAVSVLSVPASVVLSTSGRFEGTHRFGSARHLGESAGGTWTLRVSDRQYQDTGTLKSWKLKAYGHGYTPGDVDIDDVDAGPGALALTWKAPDDIGGSAVTSYDLRYADTPDPSPADWTEVTNVGSTTDLQHMLTGLEGETKYFLSVRAVNDAGAGPWSEPHDEQTETALPGPPRSVRVAARTNGLAVSWSEPTYLGVGVAAYDVRHIREDASDKADIFWTERNFAWRTGDGDLRYVIPSLLNGTRYEMQVRARNSRGEEGDWSATARGTPAGTNSPAQFPDTETGRRSVFENTPAGVDIGEPVAARDDEGDTLTYSLTSGAANFDIVDTTGQLQTKVALDRERTSSYAVTVAVHDGKASDGTASTAIDDTIRVTIAIGNVDEPPTVTRATDLTVRENNTAVATYSASDPERATSTFTWSLTGNDAGAFTISERGALTFDPAPNFEAPTDSHPFNVYEVTIQATDESAVDPNARTGDLDVEVTVEDVDESPEISGTASFTIQEAGSRFVGSYRASDPEGTDVSWETLAGPDARYFAFDELTGALSFKDTPDYDRATNGNHGDTYRVTVRASDEGNKVGNLPVTIILTSVDEPPIISGPPTIDVNEVINPTPGQVVRVGDYTRRDPEGASSNWGVVGSTAAITGPDADRFQFNKTTGRLTFVHPPDFETGGAQYELMLNANDGSLNGRLDVTVNVTDLDDPGSLTLDRRRPILNRQLIATLEDEDGVRSATWQWQRSTSRSGGGTDIENADSRTYFPVGADRDHFLRVTVEYTDGHGSGKRQQVTSEFTAANNRASNTPPMLPDSVDPISIPESTPAGGSVGRPVRATDPENDLLAYDLSGSSDFVIGRTTGQIQVAPRVTFDFESGQNTYAVTVTADDGYGGTDTVGVTIRIDDVNEAPTPAGAALTLNEDSSIEIAVPSDADPDAGDTVTLLGTLPDAPDHGTATVDTAANRIAYTPRANYHGSDSFSYRVQDSGRLTADATVALTVDPVNDAPEFPSTAVTRTVSESTAEGDDVGAPVTARDIDNATLTYRLTGAPEFEIVEDTGQITVAKGATFDIAIQNTYTVTVTADDGGGGTAFVEVTITVKAGPVGPPVITGGGGGGGGPSGPSPSKVDFEWTVTRDIEALDSGNDSATGSWSDGETLWVTDNPDGAGDGVYAYDLRTGERRKHLEFKLDERNRAPRGIWSDRETGWVSDSGQNRLFAHDLATGERLPERDLALNTRNRDARGIWSDGETMFVLDGGKNALFAYNLESGELLAEYALGSTNDDPRGIWSDSTTFWVSDHGAKRLFAYRIEGGELERNRDEEFGELSRASNNSPRGIWSDGDAMYVADESDGRVYSYNMPDAIDARLASFTLSGVEFGEFDGDGTEYAGVAADGVTEATVAAGAMQRRTDVAIHPPDADGNEANGHQVDLSKVSEVTVTVTSADGSRTKVYRVLIERPTVELALDSGWNTFQWPGSDRLPVGDALRGADGATNAITDKVVALYRWDEAANTWLVYFPGLGDVPGLNTLTTLEPGQTYWVATTEPVTWTVPR